MAILNHFRCKSKDRKVRGEIAENEKRERAFEYLLLIMFKSPNSFISDQRPNLLSGNSTVTVLITKNHFVPVKCALGGINERPAGQEAQFLVWKKLSACEPLTEVAMHKHSKVTCRIVDQQCAHLTNTSPNAREANRQDFDFAFSRGHKLLRAAKEEHSDSGDGIFGGQLPLWRCPAPIVMATGRGGSSQHRSAKASWLVQLQKQKASFLVCCTSKEHP